MFPPQVIQGPGNMLVKLQWLRPRLVYTQYWSLHIPGTHCQVQLGLYNFMVAPSGSDERPELGKVVNLVPSARDEGTISVQHALVYVVG